MNGEGGEGANTSKRNQVKEDTNLLCHRKNCGPRENIIIEKVDRQDGVEGSE